MARRVVDGLEAEDGDDARGTRLFDASAEGADLVADHLQRTRDVGRRRRRQPHPQEGQVATVPLR